MLDSILHMHSIIVTCSAYGTYCMYYVHHIYNMSYHVQHMYAKIDFDTDTDTGTDTTTDASTDTEY